MQLENYIKGDRHGKETNRLEREAMDDPFLQDALDGFDAVQGDHVKAIERLTSSVRTQTTVSQKGSRRTLAYWSSAATILLLIGFGVYFLLDKNNLNESAIVMLQANENESVKVSEYPVLQQEPIAAESISEAPPIETVPVDQATKPSIEAKLTSPAMEVLAEPEESIQAAIAPVTSTSDTQSESYFVAKSAENKEESEENAAMDEVVVVGFGSQKKQTVVGAISQVDLDEDEDAFSDEAALEERVVVQRRRASNKAASTRDAREIDTSKNSDAQIAKNAKFGEKEFQQYCQQKATKKVCNEKSSTVRVSFFIDPTGKPTQIKFDRFTCEKAKEEIEKLLKASPVWTDINQKVTMTIKW